MAKLSKKHREYLVSSVITFLTGFLVVISANFDTLTIEHIKDGTAVGIFALAVRLALKMTLQGWVDRLTH